MGGSVATGSDRTADQTATALFFSGNAQVQYTGALIDQANIRNMDIVDAARLFAAVNTSIADGLIAVWHAKLLYGFWRPITAINLADTDGNPDTRGEPRLGPAADDPALSRLRERLLRRDRRVHEIAPEDARHRELDVTLHSTRRAVDAPLRQGRRPERSGDQCPDLARHPLPVGRRRRGQDGPARRELGARPRLLADRRLSRRRGVTPSPSRSERRRIHSRVRRSRIRQSATARARRRSAAEDDRPLGGGHAPGQRGRSALGAERQPSGAPAWSASRSRAALSPMRRVPIAPGSNMSVLLLRPASGLHGTHLPTPAPARPTPVEVRLPSAMREYSRRPDRQ